MRKLLASCLVAVVLPVTLSGSDTGPNVVVILADDLGWSDTTLYGTTEFYRTPNIARLAKRGMTFTRAYSSSPLCSPTRASLLTGQSVARHGITAPQCHLAEIRLEPIAGKGAAANQKSIGPLSATRLKTEHVTLAETLKQAGYATAHFGKWHLGPEPYSPLAHGFEIDVPHWPGPGPAGSYVAPWKFKDFDPDPQIPDQHIEDRMAIEAAKFIRRSNRPFFLNYWMFSVHAPFDAKANLIEAYRKRLNPGDAQRCPTYAAMIESMDDAVGTLVETLDERGIFENTIVVFASDNGGNMYNEVEGERPTSNRPLRGGKATMYEGGIRGPAIVVWPGVVEPGSRSDELIQTTDFYPTLLEILNLPAPPTHSIDGQSIVPALKGGSIDRDAIFTFFPHAPGVPDWLPPSISVHRGDWKLIRIFHGGDVVQGTRQHRWKLFHLKDDVGEQNDLANALPDKVAELDALIQSHLEETSAVVPSANPKFDLSTYDPSLEGKQATKTRSRRAAPANSRRLVDGWRPVRHTTLEIVGGALSIRCTGNDPHLERTLDSPLPIGRYQVTMHVSSQLDGKGQIFWGSQNVKPRYARDRSDTFSLRAADAHQECAATLVASEPISYLRIDPLQNRGAVRLHSIRIRDAAGDVRWSWPAAVKRGKTPKN